MDIFGIKVGERNIQKSLMFFNEGYDSTITISYFFWCLKSEDKITLIDTGFSPQIAAKRHVRDYRSPKELLNQIGVEVEDVDSVLLTHLHWDHFGGYSYYPNANFLVHKDEWEFSTGKFKKTKVIKDFYDESLLEKSEELKRDKRLIITDDSFKLSDDIELLPLGGHTPGSQVIVVDIDNAPVIFCGDLGYFYRNFQEKNPPMLNLDIPESLEAYFKLDKIVKEQSGTIIPGHDPKIMDMFERITDRIIKVK